MARPYSHPWRRSQPITRMIAACASVFDPLGGDGQFQRLGQCHDRARHIRRATVIGDLGDERAVDLDPVEAQPPQIADAGEACAEIVERDADAQPAQVAQNGFRPRRAGAADSFR